MGDDDDRRRRTFRNADCPSIHRLYSFVLFFVIFFFLCFIYIYKQYSSCLMQIRILTQSPSPPPNLLLKVRLNCDTLSIGTG